MLDDLLLQHIRRGQVVKVVQAFVLQPEDVQAGLVAGHQVFVTVELEAIGGAPVLAVLGVVADDEVAQVIELAIVAAIRFTVSRP